MGKINVAEHQRSNIIPKLTVQKAVEKSRSRSLIVPRKSLKHFSAVSSDLSTAASSTSTQESIELIRSNIIGARYLIHSPFLEKKQEIVYADYTASGRCLRFIEDYMTSVVLPSYANTHTEASATGSQTTHLREEAREIIRKATNAPREDYVVLFTGSGSTAAIDKLFRVLGLGLSEYLEKKWSLSNAIPDQEKPIVFISHMEHHSNELMWRDSPVVRCIVIKEGLDGTPDLDHLQSLLERYKNDNVPMIGSFSAGSNVTGIKSPVRSISKLLHKYKAYAFFDYAGVGAYVEIDMKGSADPNENDSIDAAFFSPHKFIGGPGSSGVLIARHVLFHEAFDIKTEYASTPGGGTIDLVTRDMNKYSENIEYREDAGTPNILGNIRAGLAFKVKELVGSETVERLENTHCAVALNAWRSNPAIALMGANRVSYHFATRRVSIFSFNILSPIEVDYGRKPESPRSATTDFAGNTSESLPKLIATALSRTANIGTVEIDYLHMPLHYNFVIALLNDVYGIQGRGGCSCAGPYGVDLFDMNDHINNYQHCWKVSSFKPGWARVNLNYFISHHELKFITEAVNQIAKYGWLLLPLYVHDLTTGTFIHSSRIDSDDGRIVDLSQSNLSAPSLHNFAFESFMQGSKHKSKATYSKPECVAGERPRSSYMQVLKAARNLYKAEIMRKSPRTVRNFTKSSESIFEKEDCLKENVWWLLPEQVEAYILSKNN